MHLGSHQREQNAHCSHGGSLRETLSNCTPQPPQASSASTRREFSTFSSNPSPNGADGTGGEDIDAKDDGRGAVVEGRAGGSGRERGTRASMELTLEAITLGTEGEASGGEPSGGRGAAADEATGTFEAAADCSWCSCCCRLIISRAH